MQRALQLQGQDRQRALDSIKASARRLGDSLRAVGLRQADSARREAQRGGLRQAPVIFGAMLLVLDNYDSFTYNLVQYAGELGADPVVYRNDALSVEAALALQPTAIVISPGPCTPREAGISVPLVRAAAGRIPLLGVCLGHQSIGEAFGGRVVRADRLMHGKTTMVAHTDHPLFRGVPERFEAMRYHSLVVAPEGLPGGAGGDRLVVRPGPRARRSWRSAIARCRSTACSFTPSRSPPREGKRLLENFLALAA